MEATDGERREVAARLRVLAYGESPTAECLVDALYMALGLPCSGAGIEYAVIWCLADLIDPTCEMKSTPESSHRVCSRCGAFVRRDAVTSCTEVIPIRHCPNCGARVVADDAQ